MIQLYISRLCGDIDNHSNEEKISSVVFITKAKMNTIL